MSINCVSQKYSVKSHQKLIKSFERYSIRLSKRTDRNKNIRRKRANIRIKLIINPYKNIRKFRPHKIYRLSAISKTKKKYIRLREIVKGRSLIYTYRSGAKWRNKVNFTSYCERIKMYDQSIIVTRYEWLHSLYKNNEAMITMKLLYYPGEVNENI